MSFVRSFARMFALVFLHGHTYIVPRVSVLWVCRCTFLPWRVRVSHPLRGRTSARARHCIARASAAASAQCCARTRAPRAPRSASGCRGYLAAGRTGSCGASSAARAPLRFWRLVSRRHRRRAPGICVSPCAPIRHMRTPMRAPIRHMRIPMRAPPPPLPPGAGTRTNAGRACAGSPWLGGVFFGLGFGAACASYVCGTGWGRGWWGVGG